MAQITMYLHYCSATKWWILFFGGLICIQGSHLSYSRPFKQNLFLKVRMFAVPCHGSMFLNVSDVMKCQNPDFCGEVCGQGFEL